MRHARLRAMLDEGVAAAIAAAPSLDRQIASDPSLSESEKDKLLRLGNR